MSWSFALVTNLALSMTCCHSLKCISHSPSPLQFNIDENLFVALSSPSSSRYDSVVDLGTPEEAANRILDQ